ncbi:MAG: ABC transporter permease [Acidobacteriota bacterium]
MIRLIAQKEMTEMLRDGRFRWAAAIVLLLLLAALLMGGQHYRDIKRQHDLAQAETREQWLKQPAKNPHSAAHYGIYAFKPKMLAAMLDRGVDPYVGQSVWLEAHKQNDFKYRPAQDSTAVQRFGELTAATVLQLLIPLLIILLSFAAFVGEREQGTLRQLLSMGIRQSDLVWGKALGITGALGLLLIPATVIGVIALILTSENGLPAATLSRMAWMTLGYLLYFGIFIGLTLAVSATARSSQTALVILLGFWIVNCLIAPRAIADIARRVHATPSAFSFQQTIDREMQSGPDGHDSADKRNSALRERVLKQYGVDRIESLPVNFAGLSLQESEEHGNTVYDRHYGALWERFEQQNRLKQLSGIIAPMLAIHSLSMGLAGTDFFHHRDFANAAENYRRLLIRKMNDDLTYQAVNRDFSYQAPSSLWQTVEEFRYDAPTTRTALAQQRLSLGLLSLWCLASLTTAIVLAHRLKID